MIFDSHTHLNAEQFEEEIPETVERARELGVTEMAVVGFDTPTIEKSLELNQQYEGIYSIIGWHPTEAGSYTKVIEEDLIKKFNFAKSGSVRRNRAGLSLDGRPKRSSG